MAWLGLFVGLVIGAVIWHDSGWLLGGLLGWLLGRERDHSAQIRALQARLQAEAPPSPSAVSAPAPQETVVSPVPETRIDTVPALPEQPTAPAAVQPITQAATPAPAPAALPEPAYAAVAETGPTVVDRALAWMMAGNPAVRIGVLLLIIGVAFLLKYAAQYVRFPVESRYLAVMAGAAAAITFGWRQRERKPVFAHALQGGGLGIAFLTVFAALHLHQLLPAGAAFALLAGLATFSAALAVTQSAQSLAIIGLAGGFLAPILASTGQGSHVMLFSYYAVLNLGIAWVARLRAWRGLNLLGFLFTFIIGAGWGTLRYTHEHFATTEPFLVGFWLLYVALAVAFTRHRQAEAKLGQLVRDPVDATLVFGVPLVGFGLQVMLVSDFAHGNAWSAATMALVYGALWLSLRSRPGMGLLAESFCILATGFATLTIPLALDGRWTAASWALEGAGLLWLGHRQQRLLSQLTGYLLIFAAGLIVLAQLSQIEREIHWWNGRLLAASLVGIAAWLAGAVCYRASPRTPHLVLLLWGLLLLLAGGGVSLAQFMPDQHLIVAWLALLSCLALLSTLLSAPLAWPALRWPSLGLLPALAVVLLLAAHRQATPLQQGGWLAWPLAYGLAMGLLYYRERTLPRLGRQLAHLIGGWLLTAWLVWVLADGSSRIGGGSGWIWLGGLAALCLALLCQTLAPLQARWPSRRYRRDYLWHLPLPIAALTAGALLIAPWASSGSAQPLAWWPLLNPLDLGWWMAALALLRWLRSPYPAAKLAELRPVIQAGLALLLFAWLNSLLARGFHHLGGLNFSQASLWPDQGYQAALSLLWTSVALAAMWSATRVRWRALWVTGACLVGVTVLKLFVVDLAGAGSLARVVSFLGVGLLLVAVGWFAPVPPAQAGEASKEKP